MPYIGNQHNVGDHVNNFKVLDDISSHTATFNGSATSVISVADDTIRIPEHRFIQGQRVTYTNGGGGNIGGLTSGTAYYVSFDSPNTIRLATSLANANSNTVINLSSVGSGTSHTLNAAFDGINTKFKVTYASGKAARFNNATQLNVAINNVIQRPNLSASSFTEGFAIEDSHKIVFKTAPTVNDVFWGSIIANTIENFDLRDNEVNNFTGNGSTTEFTLSSIPANNESVIVTIDGVLQHPSDSTTARAYTLIDSIIQFTAAPALNAEIQVRHIGFAGASTNDVSGFYGRTGNVALTANDHITTGDLTSRNVNVSGILTASSASFGGNVSIGGTLTYEDVTNIDSVGVITARAGIDCNADLDVDGHTNLDNLSVAGVSTFSGIVAAGVGSTAITLDNSHKITFGSAHELEMFHDGSNSYIKQRWLAYPSQLNIISENSQLNLMSGSGGNAHGGYENAITCHNNGAVKLYHGGVGPHLETYGAGVIVQGNIQLGDKLIHNNDTDTCVRFPAANTISAETAGSERLRIKSDGKVGIGTNNPTELLHLAKDSHFRILLKRSGDAPSEAIFANEGNYTNISNNSSGVKFSVGSTPESKMVIRSGGVGIGTDNPPGTLSILSQNPNIRFNDTDTTNNGEITLDNTQLRIEVDEDNSTSSSAIVFRIDGSDQVTIGSDGNLNIISGELVIPDVIRHRSDANTKIRFPADDTFSVETSGSERLRITSGGQVRLGNTDITTSSAADDLMIGPNTPAGDHGITIISGTSGTGNIYFADTDTSGLGNRMGTISYYHNENYMRFSTNGNQERLRIDSSGHITPGVAGTQDLGSASKEFRNLYIGDVYIGTDASLDDARLTIVKSAVGFTTAITLHNGSGTGSKIISTRALVLGADYENNSGDSTSYMAFETNASEKVRIASDGNFGIGTDDPLGKLHLSSGTSGDCVLIIESDTDNNNEGDNCRIEFKQDGGSSQSAIGTDNNELVLSNSVSSSGGIVFKLGSVSPYTNATEKLRIHSNGNVMIGSGTPSTQLHVQNSSSVVRVESTSTSTSARVEITGASNSYSGLHFGDTSDVDNGYIRYYNADNYFIFGTAAAERVRIYSDGRVNIGGTNEVQLESGSEAILYLHGAIVGANVDFAFGQRIILDDDDTGTTTADRERGSIYAQFNGNASGGDTSDETRAWNIYSDLNINADYDNGYGVYADVRANFTSGTSSTLRGVYGICQTQSSGQITEMVGVYGLSQTTSGASSVTLNDLVGVKGRANMCAGTSTANATDLVGVWGNIDNDNNTAQVTGGKCALFYGSYDKTNGLHNPQGIRIDTSVPNYFRGAIAINGGGNFLPTGNHAIHIQNNTNATGIFLEQTGDQYNVIKGSANRSGQDNAIIDLQGWWDATQVGRIRIDTGADTSNKDDGRIQFFTASAGSLNEVMQIQENGEIAMDSAGSPSDALANLHVQNETFRVSNHTQTSSYIHLRAWESGDDVDRAVIMNMQNNVPKFNVTNQGQVFGASHHYAGRARTDANSPTNHYAHGSFGFYAYSGRTDNTSLARSSIFMRAWDQGDHGDRSILAYADSGSDSDTVNSTSDLRFVVKADGRVQGKGGSFFAGRVEHDNDAPNDYFQSGERGFIAYGNDETDETYIYGRNVADNSNIFFSEVNGEANAKIQADGDAFTDGTWSNTAADYAEMFEWSDGNTLNEERRGMTVVLDGDKIRLATDSDNKDNIIGVVSVNPVVLGDSSPLGWHGRYKRDVFGSPVKKAQEFLVWNRGHHDVDGVSVLFKQPDPNDPKSLNKYDRCPVEEIDERRAKGEIPDYAIKNNIRITTYAKEIDTETYDPTKKYIPRQQRKEWDAIGLVGKLIVKRGQPIGSRWILMKSNVGTDPNDSSIILDKYLVR